jgi:hypothetical protein
MGREVRRVPLDFDWPKDKVWHGYLNPHYRKCPDCANGSTRSMEALLHLTHLLLIGGADSLKGSLHPWLLDAGVRDVGDTLHELTGGLAGRPPRNPFGHDSCDLWSAANKIVAAAGLPKDWGTCKTCNGDAVDPKVKAAYDAWKKTDPPTGDGWQMWETTSEGSPISPVFASPEELARWLADTGASTFGSDTTDCDTWLRMINVGWAPSAISGGGKGLRSGVDFVAEAAGEGAGDE